MQVHGRNLHDRNLGAAFDHAAKVVRRFELAFWAEHRYHYRYDACDGSGSLPAGSYNLYHSLSGNALPQVYVKRALTLVWFQRTTDSIRMIGSTTTELKDENVKHTITVSLHFPSKSVTYENSGGGGSEILSRVRLNALVRVGSADRWNLAYKLLVTF